MTKIPVDSRSFDSAPAQSPTIASKQASGDQVGLVDVLALVFEWGDVECVCGTIKLAEEAGLAVVEPRDHRDPARRPVEDVVRTGVDTGVAADTAPSAYEFDHDAQATSCSSPPWSLKLLGGASLSAGKSRLRWMPRVSRRSSALAQIQRAAASIAATSRSPRRPGPSAPLRLAL